MNQLLTLSNEVLSENIGPIEQMDYDSIENINFTLDGQPHVQIIGNPVKVRKFEILSTDVQADTISNLKALGSKFKLVKGTTVYTGLILDKPVWKRITKEFYTTSLKLTVLEEGTL